MADMSVVASHASALWKRSEEMSLWDAFLMDEKSMRASLWSVTAQGAQMLLLYAPAGGTSRFSPAMRDGCAISEPKLT